MNIREATRTDLDDIREVNLSAFPDSERELIAKLASDLLGENSIPRTISLVAESDNRVVGHVVFSPVMTDDGDGVQGYILAPLAVHPDYQKHGIGSGLVETGLQLLAGDDVCYVIVYGDPDYYGRFGFSSDYADRFIPPHKLQYPFGWQVITLNDCDLDGPSVKVSCVASLNDPAMW